MMLARSAAQCAPRLGQRNTGRVPTVRVFASDAKINTLGIRKEEEKVADFVKVQDMGKKAVYCRCWRSSKFPYCDGAHLKHNKETGDNVGPLVIENPEAK